MGFVAVSHWRPYWKSFTTEDVQAMIADLNRMHQRGVVLMGMATGDKYSLPAGVATYLQMLRDAGIQPYLALWLGPFSSAETDTAVKAWNAGDGRWAGIVIDVEAGLMSSVENDRAAAIAAVGRFMTRVRPLTPFLAYVRTRRTSPASVPRTQRSQMISGCQAWRARLRVAASTAPWHRSHLYSSSALGRSMSSGCQNPTPDRVGQTSHWSCRLARRGYALEAGEVAEWFMAAVLKTVD